MAFESTAINDLVAGLQQKPLAREPEVDWLFGERDDATEIDPRAAAPEFDPMRAVSLPRPFAQIPAPAPAFDPDLLRHRAPTTHVRTVDWSGIAKKLALPIGVVSIVIVVLGVYFAKTDKAPAKAAVLVANVEAIEPQVEATPAAVVAPIAQAAAADPVAAPAAEPVAAPVPAPAEPVAAPAAEPVAAAAPAPLAVTAEAPQPEEKLNVDPGSPASRFLAPAPVETTIKVGAEKPAPAPTAVPDLAPPPTAQPIAKVAKVAKVAPQPKRATKPVTRKNVRAAKARPTKKVVAAANDSDKVAPTVSGKGILQIASSPSMQVWVDGRNSKAMTPVRIKLLAGKHRVSLLDNQRGKARSFDVVIKPDETTKVTKSY